MNSDGTSPELVIGSGGALLPRGITIDPIARRIYYVAVNETALSSIHRGNVIPARNQLRAFINEVRALRKQRPRE
jgi:hypothetical protein